MMKIFILLLFSFLLKFNWNTLCLFFLILTQLLSFFNKHSIDLFIVHSSLKLDYLALSLITLSFLMAYLLTIASISNKKIKLHWSLFLNTSKSLIIILILSFSTNNIVLFYILFESSLVPTFVIILGWGNQPERTQAGLYLMLYMVFASLPLLFSLLMWATFSTTSCWDLITTLINPSALSLTLAFSLLFAFMVKLPLFFIHLWLPKAHVEAPVAGSMILAAVLLKLGGYGSLRVLVKLHPLLAKMNSFMLSWSLVGGVLVALMCVFQSDIKLLIALSSVAHMSMVMASLLTFSPAGVNGAHFIMIGHGFCSSGLFCLANLMYERFNSRSLYLLKGLQPLIPALAVWWLLLCTSNMASPPSLNLLGEMTSIMTIFSWSSLAITPLSLLIFMAAAYSLYLYSQPQHGKPSSVTKTATPLNLREFILFALHWAPLNTITLAPWTIQIYMS